MMKKRILFVCIMAVIPFFSLQVQAEEIEKQPYVQGELIVKFEDTVTECVHCLLEQKKTFVSVTGSDSLDKLNKKWGVISAQALFVQRHSLNMGQSKEYLVNQAKERIAKKRRKRPIRKNLSKEEEQKIASLANIYILKVPKDTDIEAMALDYSSDVNVKYAEPKYIPKLDMIPTDPMYAEQWALKADKLNMEPAWELSQGEGIVVAVIDSGIDYTHNDLSEDINVNGILDEGEDINGNGVIDSNMWVNPGEDLNNNGIMEPEDFNGIDDDENGYVDDLMGWSFIEEYEGDGACSAHGTSVAGIIAAMNNGKGMVGIAPKAKIMRVAALGGDSEVNKLSALKYAADNGADIINCSWHSSYSEALKDIIDYAHDIMGCIIVVAAGNDGGDVRYNAPACLDNVITVSASGMNDEHSFSCWGRDIDIAAPFGVLSLGAGKEYQSYYSFGGTSSSTPHVAGVCALIWSLYPELTPKDIERVLHLSTDDIELPGWDPLTGYGRVNAYKALTTGIPQNSGDVILSAPDYGTLLGKNKEIDIKGIVEVKDFSHYLIQIAKGRFPAEEDFFSEGIILENKGQTLVEEEGLLAKWNTGFIDEYSEYTIRLLTYDRYGGTREARTIVYVDPVLQTGWPYDLGEASLRSYLTAGDIDGDGASEIIGEVCKEEDSIKDTIDLLALDGSGNRKIDISDAEGMKSSKFSNIYHGVSLINRDSDKSVEIIKNNGPKIDCYKFDDVVYGWDPHDFSNDKGSYVSREIYKNAPIIITDVDDNGEQEYIVLIRTIENDGAVPNIAVLNKDGSLRWESESSELEGLEAFFMSDFSMYMFAGDLDNDGAGEIGITHNGAGKLFLLDGLTGRSVGGNFPIDISGVRVPKVAAGDIDGDGLKEIVVQGTTGDYEKGTLKLFIYDYAGRLKAEWDVCETGYSVLTDLILADIDRDGDAEIITAENYRLFVFDETGEVWSVDIPSSVEDVSIMHRKKGFRGVSFLAGDIDSDGDIEIIMLYTETSISHAATVRIFNHDGTVWQDGWHRQFVGTTVSGALTDIDGDADIELVVSSLGNTANGKGSQIFVWDFPGIYNPENIEWGMFYHNAQHTNVYTSPVKSPSITAITPDRGMEGTEVTITGLNFGSVKGDGYIKFNNIRNDYIKSWSDTYIVCHVSSEVETGPVTVTTECGTSNSVPFAMNNSPLFERIDNKSVNEEELLQFKVSAVDADGDSLAYSVLSMPYDASFDAEKGIFSWKPNWSAARGRPYSATFRVRDDFGGYDTQTVEITVNNVNQKPTAYIDISGPNPAIVGQPAYVGQEIKFTGHGVDLDGQIKAYEWKIGIRKKKTTGWWLWQRTTYYYSYSLLSRSSSFIAASLPESRYGAHKISFRVKDNEGKWSDQAIKHITVKAEPEFIARHIDAIFPTAAKSRPGQREPGRFQNMVRRLNRLRKKRITIYKSWESLKKQLPFIK